MRAPCPLPYSRPSEARRRFRCVPCVGERMPRAWPWSGGAQERYPCGLPASPCCIPDLATFLCASCVGHACVQLQRCEPVVVIAACWCTVVMMPAPAVSLCRSHVSCPQCRPRAAQRGAGAKPRGTGPWPGPRGRAGPGCSSCRGRRAAGSHCSDTLSTAGPDSQPAVWYQPVGICTEESVTGLLHKLECEFGCERGDWARGSHASIPL